jgi:hypothetical protein
MVEEVVWVSENKVFVNLLLQSYQDNLSVRGFLDEGEGISKEDLERLTNLLRGAGLDAQLSNEESSYQEVFTVGGVSVHRKGTPGAPGFWVQESAGIPEIVCLWFAQGSVGALGGAATLAAVKWMKDRVLKSWRETPTVMIIEDDGEKGALRGTVELDRERSKPVVRATGRKRVTVEKPDDVRWL